MVVLFWLGTMTIQRSGMPLEPGPSSLVLLTMNQKSTVGQYRERGTGTEYDRRVEQTMTVHT